MIDFQGRVLAMTGANGGIPRAIAQLFRQAGAALFLTDLTLDGLEDFRRELGEDGPEIALAPQDVADPEAAAAAARACAGVFGGIDFLVTGAGLYTASPVAGMPPEQWRRGIAVNLDGVFHTTQAFLPLIRDGGAIVNLASMAAERGSRNHSQYAAAKGGVISFTRSLALETAPRIRVNAISPGLIDTPMVRPLMDERGTALLAATPLGRLGTVEEVAGATAFLCSDLAGFMTGETLQVNGGLHIC